MSVASALVQSRGDRLPAYSLFAAALAAAGLPIYIHAPKFYVDTYGVSLAALGTALFLLRLIDVVQDPFFGWLSERLRQHRAAAVACAAFVMGIAMFGLFAVTPPVAPLFWFALTLTLMFSGYSFLSINFYAQGVQKADSLGDNGHIRLAGWRETGALLGVCAAAVAPTLLASVEAGPFAVFATGFAAVLLIAVWAMRTEWQIDAHLPSGALHPILGDPVARQLLMIALVNATPVAISSTLFLFFVESRIGVPGLEGPLLLTFFLAAALSAPLWSVAARRHGTKKTLIFGMVLSIVSFAFTAMLGTGDALAFAVICLASGAALGADMTLLPAIFAGRMARIAPSAAQAFGLWSFVTKFTLAFAAVLLLPTLDAAGFVAGTENTTDALWTLTVLYAVVPCALKLVAIALLMATPLEES
ncbi:MAG: MFS transporter [Pseudomonadota bacterium]